MTALRIQEKIEISEDCSRLLGGIENSRSFHSSQCFAIFDNRQTSQFTALLSIIKIILIICYILIGSLCFNSETETMVIKPIRSMIEMIKKYTKNPVKAMNDEYLEEFNKDKIKRKEIKKKKRCFGNDVEVTDINKKVETIILEKTIGKVGSLLALGYGVSGSNLIERNMLQNKGIINPMAAGEKIIGIFCFCKLLFPREIFLIFGQYCAVLINEIYNTINNIIENGEDNYISKNTGDGLLLIWKLDERFMAKSEDGEITINNCPEVNYIVDSSIISIIKILIKLQKSPRIKKVSKSLILSQLQDNIDDSGTFYSIIDNISFTSNLGWAIEGATGSNFKIDISYYSPMITSTKKLESLNKYYQRNLLLFSEVSDYMTDEAKNYFRTIDSLEFHNCIKSKINYLISIRDNYY